MTALTLADPLAAPRAPSLPRRAIVVSIALHAAALLLVPGLVQEAKESPLPVLIASLRLPPVAAYQPAPAAPREVPPPPAHAPAPRLVKSEAAPALPAPVQSRSETPAAPVSLPASPVERPAPIESATLPTAQAVAAPASAPAPAPAPAPAQESVALDAYGRALSDLLARQQQYPRLAALRGWEGEVRLRLKVARKGNLVAVQVVHSSGHEVLDQHALNLVQGAPLPAPPDNFGDREIQVVVPIQYKLQKPT